MVVNQKVTGRAVSLPVGLAMGLGISLGGTLALSALVAYLQGREVIGEQEVGYFAMLTILLSAAAGAFAAACKIKRQRLIVCMASGLCYFLSLIGMTALFFGGQYSAVGVTALVILGAVGAVALLGTRKKKSTSVRISKFKNR